MLKIQCKDDFMKRPFALCGLIYLAAQTAVFYTSAEVGLIIACTSFVCAVVFFFAVKKGYLRKTLCLACAAATLASVVFCSYSLLVFAPAQQEYNHREVQIYARLTEQPRKSYGSSYYALQTEKIDGQPKDIKILLKTGDALDIQPYDYIDCTVTLEKCDNNYYLSKGFAYSASTEYNFDYDVTQAEDKPPYYYAIQLRQKLSHAVNVMMPQELAQLSNAVAFGDRFSMEPSLREDFRKTGTSYLIVVSGFHMALASAFVTKLLKKLLRKRHLVYPLSMVFVMIYMALTGFTSSVIRSGIMMIIYLIGKEFFYESDSLNSLGIAALFMCLPNPYASGDIGMLLSFSATLGIIILYPVLSDYVLKKTENCRFFKLNAIKYVLKTILLTLSAVVFTTPITVLAFGSFSPIVFIASVIITIFIEASIICTFLCALLYCTGILTVLAYPYAFTACLINKFIISVIGNLAQIDFATVYVNNIQAIVYVAALCILAAAALLFKNALKGAKYAGFMLTLIVLTGFSLTLLPKSPCLSVIGAGSGSTVTLRGSKGLAVLSCGGTSGKTSHIIDELSKATGSIDFLAVPDNSNELSRYSAEIAEEFDCSSVLLYDTDKTSESLIRNTEDAQGIATLRENSSVYVELWDEICIDALNIDGKTYEYIYGDNFSVLIFPPKGDCANLPEKYRSADLAVMCDCPENISTLTCPEIIYTGKEENIKKHSERFSLIADEIVYAGETTVNIPIKE